MPHIYDNIELPLLNALTDALKVSYRSDFCVGYFNLRGWRHLDHSIGSWAGGNGACCRLLVGMQRLPQDELRELMSLTSDDNSFDQKTAVRLKKRIAQEFKDQLTVGVPTNDDEEGLRRLSRQIKEKKVVVKLFLRHQLHAKLYLLDRADPINPSVGYLGSSNLTLAGLSKQGELNVDVLDHDACEKLKKWFEDRWTDRFCIDISAELVEIIDQSWAREELVPPYYVYLKMAYHLSQEARSGLSEFTIPRDFGNRLFAYQTAAVKIAAHHLNKRRGVILGDVVGLGKTLMATALAKIFQEDFFFETLILCPKNLTKMWQDYVDRYRLYAKVLPLSRAISELPQLRRYRLVIIDESHNLRNRDGKRYRTIREYIEKNESYCMLLSATPYNKTYLDLSAQLRLFLPEDKDLGIRPEGKLREIGESEFIRRFQCGLRSIAAFEKSEHPDDWRELMRLYLVRRTRSFIQENYALTDAVSNRRYLLLDDGSRSYFPTRRPKTIRFSLADEGSDQYANLYSDQVVDAINALNLPRYGLGNYVSKTRQGQITAGEAKVLDGLSRGGKRLMGFSRTNLFKRLESSGPAFIQSLERHILRNYVFLYAVTNNLEIPIGTQDAQLLETGTDVDVDDVGATLPFGVEDVDAEDGDVELDDVSEPLKPAFSSLGWEENTYCVAAKDVYERYANQYRGRFKWLKSSLFTKDLKHDLLADCKSLLSVRKRCGTWDATRDSKVRALAELLKVKYSGEKVLVFTQFADTVQYLVEQLGPQVHGMAPVTGQTPDPTSLAWRFSPVSNEKTSVIGPDDELRVLIATDVLSEGQNLQDCAVIVNFDLPWAIIRLIQRAGRVDRIGQKSEEILCYSFLPADGVERLIRLRSRVLARLRENAEVVGTDEEFFEDQDNGHPLQDLYNERAGILDGDADSEVDLASYCYQIWKNAIERDPELQTVIPMLPNSIYATKPHKASPAAPSGVLVYTRTSSGSDSLTWVDEAGHAVTQSQLAILRAAECNPDAPPTPRHAGHHDLVRKGLELIAVEENRAGGQLGRPSGPRYKTYHRLMRYADSVINTLFHTEKLLDTISDIYRYPLAQAASDTLNRQMKSGVEDYILAEIAMNLRDEGRLSLIEEADQPTEPTIVCSMGLFDQQGG